MSEITVKQFEERLNSSDCSSVVRTVVYSLRAMAERQEPREWTIRAHSGSGSGWGIEYKRGGLVFCRFDPKPNVEHVCVFVRGAAESDLEGAGKVHRRKNAPPWVDIRDERGAKALEPLIQRAFADAGIALKRQ